MAIDLAALCADLAAESEELDALVAPLDEAGLVTATPAVGWTIRDQLTHLAHFDDAARMAWTDPDDFHVARGRALASARSAAADGGSSPDIVDAAVAADRVLAGVAARAWWRRARAALIETGRTLDPSARVPWYGPDMTVASSLTARLMETWAHGQDVADSLGVVRVPTPRLAHVAFLAVRALPNSFAAHGLADPGAAVRVELEGTDGSPWVYGPAGAVDVVRGPALDLCLVATQRRHRDDTALVAQGPVADRWLSIAQVFAGPPGTGRPPRSR